MRIDFSGVTALDEAGGGGAGTKTAPVQALSAAVSLPEDKASLSARSGFAPALVVQALSSAETRAVKVEALRRSVANAEYAVEPDKVADAMISNGF